MGSSNSKRKRAGAPPSAAGGVSGASSSAGSAPLPVTPQHGKGSSRADVTVVSPQNATDKDSPTGSSRTPPSKSSGSGSSSGGGGSGSSSSKTSKKPKSNAPATSNDPSGFSRKKLEDLFAKYADGGDRIGPDGVCSLLDDLNLKPEDPIVLVLCWHLTASEACVFKRDEFINGLEKLRVDSIDKLLQKLPSFHDDLKNDATFRQIYEFAFVYSKEPDKRSLSIDMATAMMRILLAPRYALVDEFLLYVDEHKSCKALNLDQWISMLDLCKTTADDLSDYDFTGSWPVIYDEFVMWLKQKNPDKYGSVNNGNDDDPYASAYPRYSDY